MLFPAVQVPQSKTKEKNASRELETYTNGMDFNTCFRRSLTDLTKTLSVIYLHFRVRFIQTNRILKKAVQKLMKRMYFIEIIIYKHSISN